MREVRTTQGTYSYTGPSVFHSHIGQIMAYLGYSKQHRNETAGAMISVKETARGIMVKAVFVVGGNRKSYAADVARSTSMREGIKNHLIHWWEEAFQLPPSPWGTLIGVRPTKLVHGLLDRYDCKDDVIHILTERYEVHRDIAKNSWPWLRSNGPM